jgi:hypothetical protein
MEQGIVLESVWVAVGFVVFIALVWRKAGGAIGAMLDERSEKISSELKKHRHCVKRRLKSCNHISGFIAKRLKKQKSFCNRPKRLPSVFVKLRRKMRCGGQTP